ncbi:hypothetical protein R1sor_003545 [Riccia sorocarpa]|uniref:non-specific serine/threonine protein kinase n=1 Tax=Riccia sorocarpa TaxID=122646 RepID=A0ABD3H2Q2_9MARC
MAAAKLFFVGIFVCCELLHRGAAQAGFTSIDCGSTTEYTDELGIDWVSDGDYTSTGQNAVIDIQKAKLGADAVNDRRKLQTLRYFPGPASKHCYAIPFVANEKYLIRLTFLGGNLTSSAAGTVDFSISLGTAHWQDVQVTDPWTPIVREASYIAPQATSPICFQRGDVGDPFVNSIETRRLTSFSYQLIVTAFIYTNVFRLDCGLKSGSPSTRYPDDQWDRIWAADPESVDIPGITNANAQLANTIATAGNEPPVAVLQSAWNASTISFQLPLSALPESPIDSTFFYIVLYFVEIGGLKATDFRVVDVNVDGEAVSDSPVTLTSDSTFEAWSLLLETTKSADVTITPSSNSSVPVALLNGVEVYKIQTYNTSLTTSATAVKSIEAIKTKFNLDEWQGDPCLVWPYDWVKCTDPSTSESLAMDITALELSKFNLRGTIPTDIAGLLQLTELALDNNLLTGSIPNLSALTKLKYLRLQNNSLSGTIPDFLGSLPLSVLTLDNNLFEGELPQSLQEKIDSGRLTFSATNNPFLCFGGNQCLPPTSSSRNQTSDGRKNGRNSSSVGVIVGATVGGVVVLLLLLLLIYWIFIKKPAPQTGTGMGAVQGGRDEHPRNASAQNSFSWMEVTTMTSNFAKILGRGGYGNVYYGELPDGRKVAVKVNKGNTKHGKQQFLNEVSLLSRVHHRHLVSFIGFCNEGNHEILIYDFMSEGTLEDHLTETRDVNNGALDWMTRLDIVLNASKGIEYLHKSCNPPIIHRDIKTANILLDEHFVAKVSDFGISKPMPEENRTGGVTTDIKGTFGYLDPEYFKSYRLTEKNDVYSFGVVLLEVITGKPPTTINFPHSRASNLLDWVQRSIRDGNIEAIVDPKMGTNYKIESIWKVTELALSCLRPALSERPDMTRVLQELTEAMEHENHQTTVNVFPSPSEIPPSAFNQYQRVSEPPRVVRNSSRGDSSRRSSSQDSIATFSSYNITAR